MSVASSRIANSDSWYQTRFRRATFSLVAVVSIAAAATPLAHHWWLADLIANLRVQLLTGIVFTLICLLILRRWRCLVLLAAVTVWQVSALSSAYTRPRATQTARLSSASPLTNVNFERATLRVFLLNALTDNLQHDLIVQQIRQANADVVAILELSSELQQRLEVEFGGLYQHKLAEPQDVGNFGIGMWSRLDVRDANVFQLGLSDLPSIEIDVKCGDDWMQVIATHPLPPIGTRNFSERNQHLQMLAERLRDSQRTTPRRETIVVGDLNLTPWSPWFDDLLATTQLTSAAAGRGLQPTWYRWPAFPFGLVLDHGLYSENLRCDSRTILSDCGSDHRAVVFKFSRR